VDKIIQDCHLNVIYTVPAVAIRKDPTKAKRGYTLGFHDFATLEDDAIFTPKNSVW